VVDKGKVKNSSKFIFPFPTPSAFYHPKKQKQNK